MKSLAVILSILTMTSCAPSKFNINQLQGAWWSNQTNQTADFGIYGDQVWLDYDSGYHPCKIDGDMLIFDLSPDLGSVKFKIISVAGDRMVLGSMETRERKTYTRLR